MKRPHPIRNRRDRKALEAYERQIARATADKRRVEELPRSTEGGQAEKQGGQQ